MINNLLNEFNFDKLRRQRIKGKIPKDDSGEKDQTECG